MTQEDIIRMAREAGFRFSDEEDPLLANHAEWQRRLFERFAKLVARRALDSSYPEMVAIAAAAEREARADICAQHASVEGIAQRCAEQIRARSKT
jgi:hypothetical protein